MRAASRLIKNLKLFQFGIPVNCRTNTGGDFRLNRHF